MTRWAPKCCWDSDGNEDTRPGSDCNTLSIAEPSCVPHPHVGGPLGPVEHRATTCSAAEPAGTVRLKREKRRRGYRREKRRERQPAWRNPPSLALRSLLHLLAPLSLPFLCSGEESEEERGEKSSLRWLGSAPWIDMSSRAPLGVWL